MKFNTIVGNPPYMVLTGGGSTSKQSVPIYQEFVGKLSDKARLASFVLPSRWYSGGMASIEPFRDQMLNDPHIKTIIDFANSKNVFPGMSISGGVSIILRDFQHKGYCQFTNAETSDNLTRNLNEFPILVRSNKAIGILYKLKYEKSLQSLVYPLDAFGIPTYVRGCSNKDEEHSIALYTSQGITYIVESEVSKNKDLAQKYKVILGQKTSEHANEPDSKGMFRIFSSSIKILHPGEVCTHTYFCVGRFDNFFAAEALAKYLKTKFVRFLVSVALASSSLSAKAFLFVPIQDFSKTSDINWQVENIDSQLYSKYNLSEEEIAFIESKIKSF